MNSESILVVDQLNKEKLYLLNSIQTLEQIRKRCEEHVKNAFYYIKNKLHLITTKGEQGVDLKDAFHYKLKKLSSI